MARASRGIQEPPLDQRIAKRPGPVTSAESFQTSDLQRLSRVDSDLGLGSLPCSNSSGVTLWPGQLPNFCQSLLLSLYGIHRSGYLAVQEVPRPQLLLLSRQGKPLCSEMGR